MIKPNQPKPPINYCDNLIRLLVQRVDHSRTFKPKNEILDSLIYGQNSARSEELFNNRKEALINTLNGLLTMDVDRIEKARIHILKESVYNSRSWEDLLVFATETIEITSGWNRSIENKMQEKSK